MGTMDEDHRRDYACQRLLDDARHAIGKVLDDPECNRRLGKATCEELLNAQTDLETQSDHITAVWN